MKKLNKQIAFTTAITLIAAISIFLTGCAGRSMRLLEPNNYNFDMAYNFSANIGFGYGFNVTAEFRRKTANVWEIRLKEPFALSGMSLSYNQGTITARMENLESNPISGNALANAPFKLLIESFENAINGEGRELISIGEQIQITSRVGIPAKTYTLILDAATLTPKMLTIPDAALYADFFEVQMSQIVQVILPPHIGGEEYDFSAYADSDLQIILHD